MVSMIPLNYGSTIFSVLIVVKIHLNSSKKIYKFYLDKIISFISSKANRGACPALESCSLYCVSRDTLFSYNESSEIFLRRLMYLFVSSHYKNSPNDLQMLSDAPGHDIYCLIGPIIDANKLPDILCAIQVCYEGELPKDVVTRQLTHGQRSSGDLIPWTIAQTYQDYTFGKMAGVRIVRLATHPDYQRMGYGTKALELLEKYFQGNIVNLDEFNDEKVKY